MGRGPRRSNNREDEEEEEEPPKMATTFPKVIIVDGLPVVASEKHDKLSKVTNTMPTPDTQQSHTLATVSPHTCDC